MIARMRLLLLVGAALLLALPAVAKTKWVSVKNVEGAGSICLESEGRRIDYAEFRTVGS